MRFTRTTTESKITIWPIRPFILVGLTFNRNQTPPVNRQADHCFDDIRQALMCNADTSVVTFEWKPDYRRPWPNFAVEKTCVDWEALDKWAGDRSFQLYDQHSLVHPQLGELQKTLPRSPRSRTLTLGPSSHFRAGIPSDQWRVRRCLAWTRHAHRVAGFSPVGITEQLMAYKSG